MERKSGNRKEQKYPRKCLAQGSYIQYVSLFLLHACGQQGAITRAHTSVFRREKLSVMFPLTSVKDGTVKK